MQRHWIPIALVLVPSLCALATPSPDTPRIAVLVPRTGPNAAYGDLQYKGYELARVVLARQGRTAELRYVDVGSGSVALRDLIETQVTAWQPDAVVGPYSSQRSAEVVDLLGDRVPLILPSAIQDDLTRRPRDNLFRVALPAGLLADLVSDFLLARQPTPSRIFLVAERVPFAQSSRASLLDSIAERALPTPTLVDFDQGQLGPSMSGMDPGPGAAIIIIGRSPQDCLELTRSFEHSTVVGFLAGFLTPEYRRGAIEENLTAFLVSPWQDDSADPLAQTFLQEYLNKYRTAFSDAHPQYHNAQAHAALQIAIEAVTRARRQEVPVADVLRSTVFRTPLGRVSFVDFGGYHQQAVTGAVVQSIERGRIATAWPADLVPSTPASAEAGRASFLQALLDNEFIALFSILALGLVLGSITVRGISFGSSGVLFVALVFGHFHFTIPAGAGTFGLICFIFCVGISAGPSFFGAFAKQGATLAKLSILVVVTAGATIVVVSRLFDVPPDLAAGLFAGALTSTPALAASLDSLKDMGTLVSVGYGIAYPFGVVGVVLFVQLLPRLLGADLRSPEGGGAGNDIVMYLVEVLNPSIIGRLVAECSLIPASGCQISRILSGRQLVPLKPQTRFEKGQIVRLVGNASTIGTIVDFIGRRVDNVTFEITTDKDLRDIVVTSSQMIERRLRELDLLKSHAVVITRITRDERSFVPSLQTRLEFHDQLRVVGSPESLRRFAQACGHRQKAAHETDLLSLSVGILAGVVLGLLPIAVGGAKAFTLGLSGGLLVVSLLLGHYGQIGRIVGHIPIASRLLLMEFGLVLFLAGAGVKAGGSLLGVLLQYGFKLFLVGASVTLIPLAAGYLFATYGLRMNLLQTLGGLCGGMTSTPALGAIRSKTDSEVPMVSYAAAYPVALIFMLVAAQIVIFFLTRW